MRKRDWPKSSGLLVSLFKSPDAAGGRDLTNLLEGEAEAEGQASSDIVIGSQISEVETHALELRT